MAFNNTFFFDTTTQIDNNFDIVNRGGTTQAGISGENTSGDWCLDPNGTTSNGTGPSGPPTGRSAYAHTEASGGGTPASTTWALTRNLSRDSTTQDISVSFLWNSNFEVSSSIFLEYATATNPNATTDWTTVLTLNGNLTDTWSSASFDFSTVSASQSSTFRYRFRVSTTAAFTNDVSLSTIQEIGVDSIILGKGVILSTAEKKIPVAGLESGASFEFSQANEEWGVVSLAFRLDDSVTISGGTLLPSSGKSIIKTTGTITLRNGANLQGGIEGNVVLTEVTNLTNLNITGNLEIQVAGNYNFTNVTVSGDVTNSDNSGNVAISSVSGSNVNTSEPGIGNSQVNIVQNVSVTLTELRGITEKIRIFENIGTTFDPIAGDQIAGADDSNSNTFNFVASANANVIIVIIEEVLRPVYQTFQIPLNDTSLPIQTIVNGVYLNP